MTRAQARWAIALSFGVFGALLVIVGTPLGQAVGVALGMLGLLVKP